MCAFFLEQCKNNKCCLFHIFTLHSNIDDYPFDVPTQLYHCWEVIFEVDMPSFDIGSELICDIDDAFDDVNENPDDHCCEGIVRNLKY